MIKACIGFIYLCKLFVMYKLYCVGRDAIIPPLVFEIYFAAA